MTRIFVTWTAVGFHSWPDAPVNRKYLANPHRHVFHFRVEMEVFGLDREVEFHDVIDACKQHTPPDGNWHSGSCESIATLLMSVINDKWPGRNPSVTVSEDGECGATVT